MRAPALLLVLTSVLFLAVQSTSATPRQVAAGEAIFGLRNPETSWSDSPFMALAAGAGRSSKFLARGTLLVKAPDLAPPGLEIIDYDPTLDPCPDLLASVPAPERDAYYCEPNYVLSTSIIPDDTHYTEHQSAFYEAIHATEAWETITGCSGIKVAVIDTGVDYTHPDLAANVDPEPGYDFINEDPDPMDDNNHGTFCAGTIGAVGNNALGVTGVNWDAEIIGLKFLSARGSGKTSDAIRAIDYAISRGVRIISSSWGGPGSSEGLLAATVRARDAGILFVAAAGNDGSDADLLPSYPAAYPTENIVSVAASSNDGSLAWFSNYGATSVDLSAPGVNISSTVPGGYASMSGTSMATPLVAGAAALALCRNPDLTYSQLKELLMNTTTPVSDLLGRTASGGMLNLKAVIDNAMNPPPAPSQPGTVVGNLRVYDRITSSALLRPGRRFEVRYQLSAPLKGGTEIILRLDGRACPYRRRIYRSSTSVTLRGRLSTSIPGTFITVTLRSTESGQKLASVRSRIKRLYRDGRSAIRRTPLTSERTREVCEDLVRSLRVI